MGFPEINPTVNATLMRTRAAINLHTFVTGFQVRITPENAIQKFTKKYKKQTGVRFFRRVFPCRFFHDQLRTAPPPVPDAVSHLAEHRELKKTVFYST